MQDILPSAGASVAGPGAGARAKRIASLAAATLGVMHAALLAVCTIGHGLAMARGLNARHTVKQVDRMLSNPGIDVDQILALWVPFVIGARTSLPIRAGQDRRGHPAAPYLPARATNSPGVHPPTLGAPSLFPRPSLVGRAYRSFGRTVTS